MLRILNLLKYRNQPAVFNICKYVSKINMPSLSPTMNEGGIVEWHKKEGDAVTAGDLLCDIQTDKAVVGMEAEENGILAKIIKPKDSQNIKVGELIALLAEEGEDLTSIEIPKSGAVPAGKAAATAVTDKVSELQTGRPKDSPEKLGPAVKRLLETYGVSPTQVTHSGPKQTLLKGDLLKFIDDSKLSPIPIKADLQKSPAEITKSRPVKAAVQQPQSPFTDIELTNMRKTIAKRLSQSKSSTPHFYTTEEATIDSVLNLRKELKKQGISVSVNDFIVKACALSLRLVPKVNSTISSNGDVLYNEAVDVSIAVASDAGLITPIVFDADNLSLSDISNRIRLLAEKARANKLQPTEFIGGTFTISNLGMFGIKEFTAIINAPQCAILAVGSGITEMVFDPKNPHKPKPETRMRFTMSSDARVIDSNTAARFLNHVKSYLENPHFLLQQSDESEMWGR